MTQFRPIFLCDVTYKIMVKYLLIGLRTRNSGKEGYLTLKLDMGILEMMAIGDFQDRFMSLSIPKPL
ncbi:hypothetical protein L6164_023962 [Bauhinia variegata]|uniref:Uncharacterized protein n=1 Tax=Bauhinia variegata TaxID=167791 RepID=A0ACB9LWE9_BAUVA|nr:hypothetical protein L6164_023962 [Bauhinia variegata]